MDTYLYLYLCIYIYITPFYIQRHKPIAQNFVDPVVAAIQPGPDGRSHYWQLFGLFQRPQGKDDRGKFLFWDIKTASAKRGGKPPPESASRILASEALNCCVKQISTNKVLLITDGAPCYKSLSQKFGWRHEACNHSAGVFCTKKNQQQMGSDSYRRSGCNVETQ